MVTDIEGYSELMKQSPQLMTRALNLHNGIIRKARWQNFGYTVEQEGDSYALVGGPQRACCACVLRAAHGPHALHAKHAAARCGRAWFWFWSGWRCVLQAWLHLWRPYMAP